MRSTPFVYGPFVYFGGAHGVPIYNLRDRYLPWTRTDPPQSIQLADVFENELGFPLCASRIKCFNLFFLWIFSAHTREYNGVLAQCRRSCAATVGEFTFSLCLFTALWLSCCLLCPLSSSHGRLLADTVEVIRNRYLPSKCVHVLPFITSIFVRQAFFLIFYLPTRVRRFNSCNSMQTTTNITKQDVRVDGCLERWLYRGPGGSVWLPSRPQIRHWKSLRAFLARVS